MTTLTAGQSATVILRDGEDCPVASNGGLATVLVAPTVGPQLPIVILGPLPFRQTFGAYSEGATLTIASQTAMLDYDHPVTGSVAATISGTYAVGQTLSVIMGEGLTGGTYQWTRDGANISGATSSTYTLVTADAGTAVTCALGGVTYTATGGAVPAGGAVVEPPTGILRTITNNCLPQSTDTGSTHLSQAFRWRYPVGSGDVVSITPHFDNWAMNTVQADLLFGVPLEIVEVYVIANGVSVRVTFGGATSKTLADGDSCVPADEIPVSAFGLTSIPRDGYFDVRGVVSRPSAAAIAQSSTVQCSSDAANNQVGWFTPANTTITNINGTGAFAVTGTALYTRQSGYRPVMLGKFASGDPATWLSFGDSITVGLNESTATGGAIGIGMFAHAMHNAADNLNFRAYIATAKGGSDYIDFTSASTTRAKKYFPFAKYAYDSMGTNDFGISGTTSTNVQVLDKARVAWAALRAAGVQKIVRGSLLTRTSSSNEYIDTAGQTLSGSGWGAGGYVELFHQSMAAEVAAGRIDAFLQFTSWLNPEDPYKWPFNGVANYATTDSTHPTGAIHILVGNEIRAGIAALA